MALAETARLVTELSLRDNLSGGLARARGEVTGLNRAASASQSHMSGLQRVAGGAAGAFQTLGGRVGQVAGGIGQLAGVGGVLGLAGGLASAVSQAQHFGDAMELVHTQAGASQAEVASLTKSVLALAPAVGTTPEELAAGLFHVESAGFRGAKALDVLTVAAKGAKVGNADLESVTNALIASVNSGIKGVSSISEAMGVLNGVVGSGNMRMQDLADAFGTGILSTAKAFGISIQSVGASLADMTNQGIPAIDAATRLRMTISLLGAPTSTAATELKSIGISSTQLANDMRGPGGILAAVADLKEHLDKSGKSATEQAALVSRAFGGGRSSSAILTLLGSLDKFKTIQDQVNKSTGAFGKAWEATTRDAGFKFDKFKATVSSALIILGDELLPSITDALGGIGTWIATHQADLVNFTRSAIGVVRSAVGTITSVFGAVTKGWGMIPKPLRDLLVTGFIADKTVKFLFGFSPMGAALSGLGKLFTGSLFQRGGTPANPLYVASVGGGLGGGGGLAGAGGGKLGMLGKLLGLAGVGFAGFQIGSAIGNQIIEPTVKPARDFETGQVNRVAASGNAAQIEKALAAVNQARDFGANFWDAQHFGALLLDAGGIRSTLDKQAATLEAQLAEARKNAPGSPASNAHIKGAAAQAAAMNAPTTLAQTIRNLAFTPNMGDAGRKPILEQGKSTGFDRWGEQALAVFRQAANPKDPRVFGEISRHITELRDIEKGYLARGLTEDAAHAQRTIQSMERLIGVTSREDAKANAAIRAARDEIARQGRAATARMYGIITAAKDGAMQTARLAPHLRNIAGADYATAAHTARIANKNMSPTVNVAVNAYTSVSVSNVVRSLTSAHIATGGPGGPGGFII